MATAELDTSVETFAELWDRIGNVPMNRIRIRPPIGTATEDDVMALRNSPEKRLCELIDGVLVEKTVGTKESGLAFFLGHLLLTYLGKSDLGAVFGADGFMRLSPGQVRIPDVSFVSWDKLPGRKWPTAPIPDLVPDLAVEVLSPSNTKKEMQRKLEDYFQAGVQVVWYIQPQTRTAESYTSLTNKQAIGPDGELCAEGLLPGFSVSLATLFDKLPTE